MQVSLPRRSQLRCRRPTGACRLRLALADGQGRGLRRKVRQHDPGGSRAFCRSFTLAPVHSAASASVTALLVCTQVDPPSMTDPSLPWGWGTTGGVSVRRVGRKCCTRFRLATLCSPISSSMCCRSQSMGTSARCTLTGGQRWVAPRSMTSFGDTYTRSVVGTGREGSAGRTPLVLANLPRALCAAPPPRSGQAVRTRLCSCPSASARRHQLRCWTGRISYPRARGTPAPGSLGTTRSPRCGMALLFLSCVCVLTDQDRAWLPQMAFFNMVPPPSLRRSSEEHRASTAAAGPQEHPPTGRSCLI